MISCDFAPNETLDDAWLSLKLILQPWRWYKGKESQKINKQILSKFKIFPFLSGRAALYHLLKTLEFPKNSEILVQGFTCEAVVLPILANNLRPIYADIETDTFSLDPIDVDKKITSKTRAIILQHSFGLMPKHRATIMSLAKKHHLLLIEDIAHGFSNFKFGISNLKSVYLMSFGRSKALSSVFGGAIATNDKKTAQKIESAQRTLQKPNSLFIFRTLLYKPLAFLIKSTYDLFLGKIIHKILVFIPVLIPEITKKEKKGNYDFLLDKSYPNALAILLLHQLKKFDQIQKQRTRICQIYQQKISNSQFLNLKFQTSNLPLNRYPLLLKNREQVIKQAKKKNIYLGTWYSQPVAPKSLDLKKMRYELGTCPTAEKICQRIINLPTNIKTHQALQLINILKHDPN